MLPLDVGMQLTNTGNKLTKNKHNNNKKLTNVETQHIHVNMLFIYVAHAADQHADIMYMYMSKCNMLLI